MFMAHIGLLGSANSTSLNILAASFAKPIPSSLLDQALLRSVDNLHSVGSVLRARSWAQAHTCLTVMGRPMPSNRWGEV